MESDFYVCHSNNTANAILQGTVNKPLKKYPHNMVSEDMHPLEHIAEVELLFLKLSWRDPVLRLNLCSTIICL